MGELKKRKLGLEEDEIGEVESGDTEGEVDKLLGKKTTVLK